MLREGYYALAPSAQAMLCRYARGEMYTWLNHNDGELGWLRPSHRGVQMLDDLHLGHTVEKILAQRKFQFRYNQSFEKVLARCGDLGRSGKTWITVEQAASYLDLHRRGYAYCCEAVQDGNLVGGLFGVQIGAFISIDSMFHCANNAGKAVYGYHMANLQERGFHFVDVNYASQHCQRFGAEWVPQWQFEQMMRPPLKARIQLLDHQNVPTMPWHVLAAQRGIQLAHSTARRLAQYVVRRQTIQTAQAA